jgi:hypothetical protein
MQIAYYYILLLRKKKMPAPKIAQTIDKNTSFLGACNKNTKE